MNSARCWWLLTGILLSVLVGCQQSQPAPMPPEIIIISTSAVPEDPSDKAWQAVPEYTAKLLLQDLVDPRLMEPSTQEVRVRAITDGKEVAFRLQWNDPTKDDLPGPTGFCDACAVQLPAKIEPTVPPPQMGELGRQVEIVYWNAAWQATVDGRGDSIKDIYPNAAVDHYPFQAKPLEEDPNTQHAMALRYAPARALGNQMAGPRKTPVQDLIAEGPGTLTPVKTGGSHGRGQRIQDNWAVVLIRHLPAGLGESAGSQIALAVWEGSHSEAGARKMRTGWIPLKLEKKQ